MYNIDYIGILKERKYREQRVSLIPAHVAELVKAGKRVLVEKGAGDGAGFSGNEYSDAGAEIVLQHDAWTVDLAIKVKDPIESEYKYFRRGLILMAFYHFSDNPQLQKECKKTGLIDLPYENYYDKDGSRPILGAMSRITGESAAHFAAWYLRLENGGKGILFSDSVGTILGANGVVGRRAYEVARGMGAKKIFSIDINGNKFNDPDFLDSNSENIAAAVKASDFVICGAVIPTLPGRPGGAPKILTFEMVRAMESGSVVIDIARDEGGNFEGTQVTTHENPVYTFDDKIIYAVINVPGSVPRTSARAISEAILPYVKIISGITKLNP